ncbi:MAG: TldD/PmbA family protein [Thermotogaceae bacterium]|nr:TldD/PmbA family protein [Mesotoga sp.]NLX34324.1 TldD/PmbA family protein [Thermotogaceae bacterium]MDD4479467.1 TldD/PmbA family protein [Mesotoga sp.]MDD5744663.1 TldD/PmbA family protein [Mesotoga sp.]HOY25907.1 TldD/PmbA family protein [Mesotoga sp.]
MKVGKSRFLLDKRPALKKLVGLLGETYPYVSILGTDVAGKTYRVTTTGIAVKGSDWLERGFVIRVHDGQRYFEYSFNEVDEDSLEGIAEYVRERTGSASKTIKELSLSYTSLTPPEEEKSEIDFEGEVAVLPGQTSPGEIIRKLSAIRDRAHAISEEIVNVMTLMENVRVSKLFVSTRKDLYQSYMWSQAALYVLARRDGITKYGIEGFSGLKGLEILDEMESKIDKVVDNARMLLSAGRIEPGVYDVICSPDVAGLIAHEAFGHGVEMDMFVKGRAKAVEYMDREVASGLVTMHDGAASAREVSSYVFDDEGTLAHDTVIIDGGILKRGISDIISATVLGTEPTGNGKRESFERKAYARMTNTYFAPGSDSLEEMIASIESGYLLENYYSGMEDPKNWGIQCVIAYGREIKDGKFTGKVVSPVMMTGYVPTLLKSISMVSGEIELSGTGACGKGHKEFAKVSSGGPYIKAKARLG